MGRLLLAAVVALVLAAPAAATDVPQARVAAGFVFEHDSQTHRLHASHVYVASTYRATARWRDLLESTDADALRRIDFRRYGVVVVFHVRTNVGVSIERLSRMSTTLMLDLIVEELPPACTPEGCVVTDPVCGLRPCSGAYEVVRIPKPYLHGLRYTVVRRETRVGGG